LSLADEDLAWYLSPLADRTDRGAVSALTLGNATPPGG
jgi:hypothetical protein